MALTIGPITLWLNDFVPRRTVTKGNNVVHVDMDDYFTITTEMGDEIGKLMLYHRIAGDLVETLDKTEMDHLWHLVSNGMKLYPEEMVNLPPLDSDHHLPS